MIQRIQTVYLLLSGLLIASMLQLDFAELLVNGELFTFSAKGIFSGEQMIFNGLPVMIFIGLISLLHFIIIFMYKKRILQMRMVVFTIILLLGLIGVLAYFLFAGFETTPEVAYKIPLTFPLLAIILDYLAIRGIGRDEALIRSMDRIR